MSRLHGPVAVLVAVVSSLAISTRRTEGNARAQALWDVPREIHLSLPPGQPLSSGINLSLFEPFVAGMSLEEAQDRHGSPQRLLGSLHYDDWRYSQYRTAAAVVEVAYEPGGDTCGTHHRRTLYAYPVNEPWALASVVRESLIKSVNVSPESTRVLVMAGDERAWCLVRAGKVEAVNWYRPSAR